MKLCQLPLPVFRMVLIASGLFFVWRRVDFASIRSARNIYFLRDLVLQENYTLPAVNDLYYLQHSMLPGRTKPQGVIKRIIRFHLPC